MAIHLWPSVARQLMRPTRGLGSAPLPRRWLPSSGLRPPIWPCSGWSLPVSLRATASRDLPRHCGTGPRLAAGGRYPPPCAAELGLSSRRGGCPARRATIRPPPDRRIVLPGPRSPSSRATVALGRAIAVRPAGERPTEVRQRPPDRSPRSRVRRRSSSGLVARARRSTAQTPRAPGGRRPRAGSALHP